MNYKIVKRNNSKVDFNPSKIFERIKKQSVGLNVSGDELFLKVTQGIADSMTTKQIDDLISQKAAAMSYLHPDYSKLAANICISRHHKETDEDILKTFKKLKNAEVIHEKLYQKLKDNYDVIKKVIDYDRDYVFDYLGWMRLKEIYLLKIKDEIVERPQHMYMRVALTVTETIEDTIKYYHLISQRKISSATPTMANAGTITGQLASCNLSFSKGDDTDSLLKTFNNICISSSKGEGIGLALHNIRSKESFVGKENGKAGGLLKYLKIVNEGLRFWNQRGKRPGAAAIYLEPWHKDIFDLLEIRLPTGADELRTKDLFTALWIPDNFMAAVEGDLDWHLFCPNDIEKAGLTPLYESFGEEYEILYQKAVDLGIGKKVKATDIWKKIIESQIETGLPYIAYKDHVNKKTNQSNIGVIKSSNLCIEINEVTDKDTTAICSLSSLPVQRFITDTKYDFKALYEATYEVAKSINVVIDNNQYSTEEGRKGGLEQRAMGIGIQGLADAFAILGYSFTSDEAKQLNKDICETIYFASIRSSCDLAKKTGKTYDYYEGSPISKGIFQWNMWGLEEKDLSGLWEWSKLREDIFLYGVRNSLFTALMPTASSASVCFSNEAFEPFNSNMYTREVIGGVFTILNTHLVKDLEKENLWSPITVNEIMINNGSIQNIEMIPEEIRERYKTVFEISQKDLISMAADRAPFIDQSQSMNIFMSNPTMGKLTSSHFHAWKLGLKTGMYYLRSKPIEMKSKHLAADLSSHLTQKPDNSEFDCFGCSA